MKWIICLFIFSFLLFSLRVSSEETVKHDNNLGVLPAVSFSTDDGFQYGAILNLFNYGDGSRYPVYNYSTYLELSRYTKGSSLCRLYFDTDKLFPRIRCFIDLTYLAEDFLDFYGYNGYQSIYSPEYISNNQYFYKMSQKQLKMIIDLKGNLPVNNLFWLASYNLIRYRDGSVDYTQINKEKSGNDQIEPGGSLYEKYVDWGLISNREAKGGTVSAIKAGLVYDTRNALNNPDKGLYTEALIEMAPGFMNKNPYTQYAIIHRQYQRILKNKLNIAVRLGVQGKIGENSVPYFRRTQLISPFAKRTNVTGFGGANSMRGILKNRVTGDAVALGNFELRWKISSFRLINQNFYIGLNSFFDTGIVLDPINLSKVPEADKNLYFDLNKKDRFHSSTGGGLKLVMNENFIVSAEFGKALNKQDGANMGSYMDLNYLF